MKFNSSSLRRSAIDTQSHRTSRWFFNSSDYGDTRDQAEKVGKLRQNRSYRYSGDVGGSDRDYFKFKLGETSDFSATLRNESNGNEAIAFSILNRQGQVIRSGGKTLFENVEASDTESISVDDLAKGTYYLRVESFLGQNEDYELSFSLSRSSDDDPIDDGDTRDLGRLRPGESNLFRGTVGGSDVDFFRFDIDRTSRISASLFNDSSDRFVGQPIAISILDEQGRVVQSDNGRFLFANVEPKQRRVLLVPQLESGEYVVRLQSDLGRNLGYSFRLTRSDSSVIPL